MVRVGGIIVIGAIFAVLAVSFFFYSDEVLTEVMVSSFGEPVQVGDGCSMYNMLQTLIFSKPKEFKLKTCRNWWEAEASNEKPTAYFKIQVTENKGNDIVRFTGPSASYDGSNKRFSPIFVGYGENELSLLDLEPKSSYHDTNLILNMMKKQYRVVLFQIDMVWKEHKKLHSSALKIAVS